MTGYLFISSRLYGASLFCGWPDMVVPPDAYSLALAYMVLLCSSLLGC